MENNCKHVLHFSQYEKNKKAYPAVEHYKGEWRKCDHCHDKKFVVRRGDK